MPTLDITQEMLEMIPAAARVVLAATMFWPNDRWARSIAIRAGKADIVRKDAARRNEALSPEILNEMFAVPRVEDIDIAAIYQCGHAVGDFLYRAVGLHLIGKPERLESIKARVEQHHELGRNRKHQGKPTSTFQQAWKDFRSVSHFWAAHAWHFSGSPVIPCHPNRVAQFLADAEYLRLEGESIKPWRSPDGTILKPGTCWAVAPDISLPAARKVERAV
jgi:hypothetical protein